MYACVVDDTRDGSRSSRCCLLVFEQEKHPEALDPYLPEIGAFAAHNHYNVLVPILKFVVSCAFVS